MIKAMLEAGIIDLNKTANPVNVGRMLADDEAVTISYLEDTDAQIANAVDAGLDSQIEESEVADVAVEIDQSEPTEALDAISNVSDEDTGSVGGDSSVPVDDGEKSGTSFMTWVMYIGGAVLVLVLIMGLCHVLMNRKDASDFEHNNTEMTHHDNMNI
jgi:hypothetical protein